MFWIQQLTPEAYKKNAFQNKIKNISPKKHQRTIQNKTKKI